MILKKILWKTLRGVGSSYFFSMTTENRQKIKAPSWSGHIWSLVCGLVDVCLGKSLKNGRIFHDNTVQEALVYFSFNLATVLFDSSYYLFISQMKKLGHNKSKHLCHITQLYLGLNTDLAGYPTHMLSHYACWFSEWPGQCGPELNCDLTQIVNESRSVVSNISSVSCGKLGSRGHN